MIGFCTCEARARRKSDQWEVEFLRRASPVGTCQCKPSVLNVKRVKCLPCLKPLTVAGQKMRDLCEN
jgi:hypothetical protein